MRNLKEILRIFRSVRVDKLILAALILSTLLPGAAHAAASFVIDTTASISLREDNSAAVKNVYDVRNLTRDTVLSSYTTIIPLETATNLRAASAGRNIPVTANTKKVKSGDIEVTIQEISVSFPVKTSGLNRRWQFTLEYETPDFIEVKGGVRVFYHPQISTGEDDGIYTLSINAPTAFGKAHYSRLKPSRVLSFGSTQTARYDKSQVSSGSFEISYGDFAVYSLDFKFPLKNPYPFWRNVSVTLPPQLATQDVLIKSITPRPNAVEVDDDGNIRVTFFMNPLETATVNTDIIARIKVLEYDLSISGGIDEIPSKISERYTISETYWEKDNEAILKSAKERFDASKSVAENVRVLYRYTIDTLSYNNAKILLNERQGALKALSNPENSVCMEYADFLIAHLRAVEIPARNPVGYAYSEGLKNSSGVADSLHSWVEVYIPNVGWVVVDPTWGEKIDNFGVSDVDHIAFAMYGRDSDDPQPVYVGKRSAGYQYENTLLAYGENVSDLTDIKLDVISYPLPFFTLTHVKAVNAGNTTIADLALKANGASFVPASEVNLGSSAPYGENEFYFLSWAVSPTKFELTLTGADRDGRMLSLDSFEGEAPSDLAAIIGGAAVLLLLWWPAKKLIRAIGKK